MRYANRPLILLIILLVIMLSGYYFSARSTNKDKDPFYKQGSGWDYLRFPLVKPYYAIKIENNNGWAISLQNELPLKKDTFSQEIHNVRKIAIENNVIMIYSLDDSTFSDGNPDEKIIFHWFVLIPSEHIEIGFEKEADFSNFIRPYRINTVPWLEPLSVLQTFDQTGCLDWIPECN